jgi:light-regulated signal transduction histidine kinase (bacteriophytochrome)
MAEPDRPCDQVDLTNCDRETIHIPGAILPHGAMLVLDSATLRVLQAAKAHSLLTQSRWEGVSVEGG